VISFLIRENLDNLGWLNSRGESFKMYRWHAKMICGIIMFIDMPICFLLPVKMTDVFRRWGARGQMVLDVLTCFAGGVFLASYLVFMAPAVRVLIEDNFMTPNRIAYPLPDMIIGLGFFGMMMIDKLVKFISKKTMGHKKRVNVDDNKIDDNHIKMGNGVDIEANEISRLTNSNASNLHRQVSGIITENEDDSSDDEFDRSDIGATLSPNQVAILSGVVKIDSSQTCSRRQSIVEAAEESTESMTRSIVMMLALSIDSVLEGMTIGLKKTVVEVWAIFIGIIVHESVIAFCLGLQLVRLHKRFLPVLLASIVYTLMNPIGVIVATLVYETMESDHRVELANGILQALTSGCFIYIIFYEFLEGQINQSTPFIKILATFVGYIFLASFAAIPGSNPYDYGDVASVEKLSHNITNNTALLF